MANQLKVLVDLASSGTLEKYIDSGSLLGTKNFEVANKRFGFSNAGFSATSASLYASGAIGVFAAGTQDFAGETALSSTVDVKAEKVKINQFTFLSESNTLIGGNLVLTDQLNIQDTGFLAVNGSGGLTEVIHGLTWNVPIQISSSDNINHAIVKDSSGSMLFGNNIEDLTLWGQTAVDISSYGGNATLFAQNGANKVILSGSGGIILSSSAKLRTTSAGYTAIGVTPSSGLYDIDGAVSGINTAIVNLTSSYDSLRYVTTGSFSSVGHAEINLTTAAGSKFATTEINNLFIDVMVDANTGYWTNDLVSIKLQQSSSATWVVLDAPACDATCNWKLIAVNEAKGKFSS